MNKSEPMRTKGLSTYGLALVVTQLFRLLYGGYLMGLDQFYYNDAESALTVLAIYSIVGILTAMFLLGKRYGLLGLVILSAVLLVAQVLYTAAYFSLPVPDSSWHNPTANWFSLVSIFLFPILTILFGIGVYREKE